MPHFDSNSCFTVLGLTSLSLMLKSLVSWVRNHLLSSSFLQYESLHMKWEMLSFSLNSTRSSYVIDDTISLLECLFFICLASTWILLSLVSYLTASLIISSLLFESCLHFLLIKVELTWTQSFSIPEVGSVLSLRIHEDWWCFVEVHCTCWYSHHSGLRLSRYPLNTQFSC